MNCKRRYSIFAALFFSATLVAGFSGCEVKENSVVIDYRSQLKLDSKPGNAAKIGDAQTSVADTKAQVTIVGKADLQALPAGDKPKAVMLVREIIADSHGHGSDHDASSCAFCRHRQKQAPKAAVEFVGTDGKVLPYTVGTLFGLQNGDEVVVTGTATMDANAEMLKVTAHGLYFKNSSH